MTVSVLVPFADQGCPWRARAWEWVRSHYARHHAGWQLVVGTCAGPWSKGAAIADAYRRADGDVLVLADADSFVDPHTLARCAHFTQGWAVPHGIVHRLSHTATERLYAGQPLPDDLRRAHHDRRPYTGPLGGGIVVLTRQAYEAVGGIDTRFHGWGGEDISFGWALGTIVGPGERLGAPLVHLWHPHATPPDRRRRGCPESEALAARYRAARGNPAAMAALVAEREHAHAR